MTFDILGPEGAKYQLRNESGKQATCRQIDRGTVTDMPTGIPLTSNRRTELICENAEKLGKASRILVKVAFDAFTYDFEVPATPVAG